MIAFQLPFLLVSIGLATTGAVAVLDREAGVLQIRTRIFGIATQQGSFPISSIERAAIQAGKGTQRLIFVLKDGSVVPLGFLTNQGGHSVAVKAVNDFLN